MIQKNYHITKDNDLTVESVAGSIAAADEYINAAQVLICVFAEVWDSELIRGMSLKIKQALPKAEIAGITHNDFVLGLTEPPGGNITLNILYFDEPSFSIVHHSISSESDEEAGEEVNREIRAVQDVKGVMLFASEYGRNMDTILDVAGKGLSDIPIFGAPGGMSSAELASSPEVLRSVEANYVFDGKDCYHNEILLVLFHGRNIRIKASYNLGWTPVGKVMTITSMDGDFRVKEIDGRPAGDIYRKYLGLGYSQVGISNSCEFPLVVERNGRLLAKIPIKSEEDGTLVFSVPLRTGDSIRFTYGAQFRIFSEVYKDSLGFGEFVPQGMFLVICANRVIFLKDAEKYEVDMYLSLIHI